jgi:HEPN domain-containing protein
MRTFPSHRAYSRTSLKAESGLENTVSASCHWSVFLSLRAALEAHLKLGILPKHDLEVLLRSLSSMTSHILSLTFCLSFTVIIFTLWVIPNK